MPVYGSRFVTPEVTALYTDLLKPDEYRGNVVHKVQVEQTKELMDVLQSHVKSVGGKSINGIREGEDKTIIAFKTKNYTKQGIQTFPEIYDAQNNKTTTAPFGGARIRLQLLPMMLEDETVSFLLTKVQIIDLGREESGSADFDAVEDGFVSQRTSAPESVPAGADTEDDIPF